jgi:hypothetical protein
MDNYAFIKNGLVVICCVFDNPDENLLNTFKNTYEADIFVNLKNEFVIPGQEYYREKFWNKQPYPSWTRGEYDWEPPIECPTYDPENPKYYLWDEESTSWIEREFRVE